VGRHSFTAAARACTALVACLGFVLPVGCSAPAQTDSSTQSEAAIAPGTLEGAYEATDLATNSDPTAITAIYFDGKGTYSLWRNKGCNDDGQEDCPLAETGSYSLTAHELRLTDANSGVTTKLPLDLPASGGVTPQDLTSSTGNTVTPGAGAPVSGDTSTVSNGTPIQLARNDVVVQGRQMEVVKKRTLPPFDDLWKAYPHEDDSSLVKKQIGGAVDASWITNTCTVRLSQALNGAGFLLPSGPKSTTSGLHTIVGGDGNNYAYRVAELGDYLTKTVGPAPVVLTGNQINKQALAGQRGIVKFTVPFSDATGHFDLWDGSQPAHAEYFDRATKVEFWPTP
jgi:hypothetical protein